LLIDLRRGLCEHRLDPRLPFPERRGDEFIPMSSLWCGQWPGRCRTWGLRPLSIGLGRRRQRGIRGRVRGSPPCATITASPSSPSLGRLRNLDALKIGGLNGPGRAFAGLARRQHALDDQSPDACGTNGEGLGRLVKRHLAALGAFALSIKAHSETSAV